MSNKNSKNPTKRKDLIIKLGQAFERKVSDTESICEEIKNALGEEIAQRLISIRDIERYCPDKWKKKTRPKKRRRTTICRSLDKSNRTSDQYWSTLMEIQ